MVRSAELCPGSGTPFRLTDFQVMRREAYTLDGFDPAVGGTRSPVEFDHGAGHGGGHGGHEGHTG